MKTPWIGPENKTARHVNHPEPRTHSPTNPRRNGHTHLPIHPPMYYSSTAVCTAASSKCVRIYLRFILLSCWDFHFFTILLHPGERASRPREGVSPRPPLAESVIGARSFAMASEGCCAGQAWSHREAAGGRVELGSCSYFLGMLQQKYFQRSVLTSLLLPCII